MVIFMNVKTMDGLIGAGVNMNLMDVPIRVYKEARRKGDLATMERSMGYAGDFAEKAWEYEAKADEGMKEEAREKKEEAKEALAETIEKRQEERRARKRWKRKSRHREIKIRRTGKAKEQRKREQMEKVKK